MANINLSPPPPQFSLPFPSHPTSMENWITAGHSAEDLAALGLLTFAGSGGEAGTAGAEGLADRIGSSREASRGSRTSSENGRASSETGRASSDNGTAEASSSSTQQSLVAIGPGLQTLPRRLVDRIQCGGIHRFLGPTPSKGEEQAPCTGRGGTNCSVTSS